MKATEQYFPVLLSIVPYKVVRCVRRQGYFCIISNWETLYLKLRKITCVRCQVVINSNTEEVSPTVTPQFVKNS